MRQAKTQCHLHNHNTVDHHLVVTEDYDEILTQVFKGKKHPLLHFVSKREEADVILTQRVMYIGHNKSRITLIADDTDVLMKGAVPK